LENFLERIGMLTCFEDLGVPASELKELAEASLVLPDYKNHPKVATQDEVYELLKRSCRS
jgi:alcohol dehydrogenase class IV